MPLGDPGGCKFEREEKPLTISDAFITIPVADMDRAVSFYCSVLGSELISRNSETSILMLGNRKAVLVRMPGGIGTDTGIFLSVGDLFGFNRRMVDAGITMIRHPQRGSIGVYASFADSEGNILHAIS